MLMRISECDSELGGVEIPEGSMVFVLLGAANRDADAFEDPDRFDVERNAQGTLPLASATTSVSGPRWRGSKRGSRSRRS